MWKQFKGITLLEVLISLAVLAVLAVAAIPYFLDYLKYYQTKSAAENFYHFVQKTRSEAVQSGSAVNIVFQTGTGSAWCYGATTAATCDCQTAASCNMGQKTGEEHPYVVMSLDGLDTGPGVGDVTISASRGSANKSGSVLFTTTSPVDTYEVKIGINRLGTTSICANKEMGGYKQCP